MGYINKSFNELQSITNDVMENCVEIGLYIGFLPRGTRNLLIASFIEHKEFNSWVRDLAEEFEELNSGKELNDDTTYWEAIESFVDKKIEEKLKGGNKYV